MDLLQEQCCFCGEEIREERLHLLLTLKDGGEQSLPAHWKCLRRALHETVPVLDAADYE